MAITVWNQENDLERPPDELLAFGLRPRWHLAAGPLLEGGFVPIADVLRRGDDLIVRAELPGIDPKQGVTVTVTDDELVISGERKQTSEDKKDHYYRSESRYGVFARHVPLPKGIDASDVESSYRNGILEVIVHRGAKVMTREAGRSIRIKVHAR